jgi:hypothetical protein
MESRSVNALEDVKLDVPAERWKIGVSIEYPCDVVAER